MESKIFFRIAWGIITLLFGALAAVTLRSPGEHLYYQTRIFLSTGTESHFLDADYRFRCNMGPYSRSQALCQRMHASLELGHPIEKMLDDYVLLKKIDPNFYAWYMRLPEIAAKLAERGHHDKSVEMFEELLVATQNIKTDHEAYTEFKKGLAPEGKRLCTFTGFQRTCKLCRENAKESYANFLLTTKNTTIRKSPRTLQFIEQLAKENPSPVHTKMLANALAVSGDFNQALAKLATAEKLHKEVRAPHLAKEFDAFLEMTQIDRKLFIAKKVFLSPVY